MEDTLIANLKGTIYRYRWRILFSFTLLAISNVLLIVNPLIFRKAVVSLDGTKSVWGWVALLVFISFLSAVLKYAMRLGFFSVGRDAEMEMRAAIFNKIQAQSMQFFDRHGTGELLSRLTNDISAYRDVLGPGIMMPLFFLTILVPAFVALFTISVPLALLSLIPLFVIPLFNQGIRGKIFELSLRIQRFLADLSNMAQEHYSGIRIIKSYAIEPFTTGLFSSLCRKMIRTNFKLVSFLGMILPFFNFITKSITVLVVLFSGAIILKGWGKLAAADFLAFVWIQSYIFFPMLMLGWVLPIYARGSSAYHRLVEVYKEPIEVTEGTMKHLTIGSNSDLEISHLTFNYPQSTQEVLSDINIKIEGGTFVGITGPVGSGKTTLFKLINREYEIPPGKIFIGGHDIRDYPFSTLRKGVVTVEQAPFLFSKTIADNVRFGKEEASMIELEHVSEFADLHETVLEFPLQYETVVGERGVTLSGGQKQRIALARAFLVDRSVLLLDDIFSAVDAQTERKIFNSLIERYRGKTILLITHRVSILEKMDRVIYMQGGKILEDGSPAQLMAKMGYYAALAQLQI